MASKHHIFIVEDEEHLAGTLALNLKLENYTVSVASTGNDAIKQFRQKHGSLSLVLMDVMLPDITGFDLCGEFKRLEPSLPVIFLTAKNQTPDKIGGLRLGADDYITKPFDLEELILRISNLIKRTNKKPARVFVFGNCSINFETYGIIDVKGKPRSLSKRETALLELLTGHPNKVISRDEIIEKLWDADENASSRTIDNYILAFRKYFEPNPKKPVHFHSIRGVGYKFTL
jgi:two-component system alkaline phosphatase synthesis response regulator PhoP